MKKVLSLLLALAMTLALAACGSASAPAAQSDSSAPAASADAPAAPAKDSLTLMTVMKCESMDPYSGSYGEKTVPRMVFDTLVDYDKDGNFVPCLATGWTDEGMDVTFTLRDDVFFTDGEHFSADDVMFAYEMYAANPAFAARLSVWGTVEKLDDYTVVFHKLYPYAALLPSLAEQFHIVSSKAYQADPAGFANNPIGSGPYKYVSQDVDGSVNFVANEDYFKGAPSIKNLTIKPPVDASTAVIALQTGELDLAANLPMAQKALIESDPNLKFIEKNAWIMSMLILGGEQMEDPNLRKAVYYALDLESIVLIGNEGVGAPATDLCASQIMGEFKGKVPFGEYDLEKAKEYLAKSDYVPGTEITLSITPEFASVAQVVQSNLGAIGINVKIDQMDLNSLYAVMFSGEMQMTVTYIGNPITTIENIIDAYNTVPFDTLMHKTPELDAAINNMKAEVDAEKRAEYILEALQLIKDNADYIPLFEYPSTAAYVSDLDGVWDIFAASYMYYVNEMSFK